MSQRRAAQMSAAALRHATPTSRAKLRESDMKGSDITSTSGTRKSRGEVIALPRITPERSRDEHRNEALPQRQQILKSKRQTSAIPSLPSIA